jgi:hypothetical protein
MWYQPECGTNLNVVPTNWNFHSTGYHTYYNGLWSTVDKTVAVGRLVVRKTSHVTTDTHTYGHYYTCFSELNKTVLYNTLVLAVSRQ